MLKLKAFPRFRHGSAPASIDTTAGPLLGEGEVHQSPALSNVAQLKMMDKVRPALLVPNREARVC